MKPGQDQNASFIAAVIPDLEPFKQYALFVRSYTVATADRGAMTPILYFTTKSDGRQFYTFSLPDTFELRPSEPVR